MEGIARAASQFREGSLYNDAGSTIDGTEFQFDDLVINSAAYRRVFASQVRRLNASPSLPLTGGSSPAPHHPVPATQTIPEGLPSHPGARVLSALESADNWKPNTLQASEPSQATRLNNYPDAVPPPPAFEAKIDLNEAGMSSLHIACRDGTIVAVEMLLKQDVDPSVKTIDLGWTPLHYAIRRKRYQLVELLFKYGAKNLGDMNGVTPLHFAAEVCSGGHFSTILDHFGVKSMRNILDEAGRNPIHYAAFAGNLKVIKLLDQRGALIDQEDYGGFLPLYYACRNGHLECVRILSAHWTSLPKNSLDAWRKVVWLALTHHRWQIAELLLGQWASEPGVRKWGQALLFEGIFAGSTRLLDLVPLESMDLNTYRFEQRKYAGRLVDGPCSYTIPLFLACGNTLIQVEHQVAIVKWLLAHGASPDCQDSFSNIPMHEVARRNNVAIAQALLEYHSPLEPENNDGETPLHMAVRYGAIDMVRFLLEKGVYPRPRNKIGLTPASMPINALDIEGRPISVAAEKKIRKVIDEHYWPERRTKSVKIKSRDDWNAWNRAAADPYR
jgi:ankyrin repeat protein